jgi:hypothetical protein
VNLVSNLRFKTKARQPYQQEIEFVLDGVTAKELDQETF